MRFIKYTTSLILKIILRAPLVILTQLFWGLGELLTRIGDGTDHAQRILQDITVLPYIKDYKKELGRMKTNDRKKVMRRMVNKYHT